MAVSIKHKFVSGKSDGGDASLVRPSNWNDDHDLTGLGTGVATFLETPSSANLAAAVTDETGSGALVFGTSPALTSPTLTTPTINSAQVATVDGTAPIFMCRAWVNFNGTANTNLSGTYSRTGTTVTVTATDHGLIVGNTVNLDFTSGAAVDGIFTVVTVADANTFTVTHGTSGSTSGNVTLLRNTIRASGNVSSISDNGSGDFTVNFATAMPDADYASISRGSITSAAGSGNLDDDHVISRSLTTSNVRLECSNSAATKVDFAEVYVAVFR